MAFGHSSAQCQRQNDAHGVSHANLEKTLKIFQLLSGKQVSARHTAKVGELREVSQDKGSR